MVIWRVSAKVGGTDWDCSGHIPENSGAPLVRHELSPWQPLVARQPLRTNLTAHDAEKYFTFSVQSTVYICILYISLNHFTVFCHVIVLFF